MEHVTTAVLEMRAQLGKALGSSRAAADLIDRFDRWGTDMVSALNEVYQLDAILPELVMLSYHQQHFSFQIAMTSIWQAGVASSISSTAKPVFLQPTTSRLP